MRSRRRTTWFLVSSCATAALLLAGCPNEVPPPRIPPPPPQSPPVPRAEADPEQGASLMGQGLDPVCKMTVDLSAPPADRVVDGVRYVFCNESCAVAFVEDPAKYLADAPDAERATVSLDPVSLDPVCGMSVDAQDPAAALLVEGRTVLFCSEACAQRFKENPGKYPLPEAEGEAAAGGVRGE